MDVRRPYIHIRKVAYRHYRKGGTLCKGRHDTQEDRKSFRLVPVIFTVSEPSTCYDRLRMSSTKTAKKPGKPRLAKNQDLLVEILCEELPPGVQTKASADLASSLISKLDEARLVHGEPEIFSTPRRLAVVVRKVAARADQMRTVRRGPRVEAAFRDGQPTPAALGFAKSAGLTLEKIGRISTDKGTFLEARILEKGLALAEAMGIWLSEGLAKIRFPKVMAWDDGQGMFSRPVRGIMMVYGSQVLVPKAGTVPFGLRVRAETRGPRYLGSKPLFIRKASNYAKTLAQAGIVADPQIRRRDVETAVLKAVGKIRGARLREDNDLLDTVTRDVEGVCVLLGNFDKEFLELPEEVIVTAMKEHQKYFAVETSTGKLLPYFLAAIALESPDDQVRRGHEKVLRARLEDARFYMAEDLKTSMDEKMVRLKEIVFVEGLGSLADRVDRLVSVVEWLSKKVFSSSTSTQAQNAVKIARWAKADLVTEMIKDGKEFTKLQGTIGRIYAKKQGAEDIVARGIEDHYRPRYPGDALPKDLESCVVALADKADHMTAGFLSGKSPTGSADPYGLRRHAMGILVLIRQCLPNHSIRLRDLFRVARAGYAQVESAAKDDELDKGDELEKRISDFVSERLAIQLREEGISHDSLDAVRAAAEDDPVQFEAKAKALESWRSRPESLGPRTALLRVLRILSKNTHPPEVAVDSSLFAEKAEGRLQSALEKVSPQVAQALGKLDYPRAWKALELLRKPIDEYFDKVMVIAKDVRVKENRLALLQWIQNMAHPLGDLTKLKGGP